MKHLFSTSKPFVYAALILFAMNYPVSLSAQPASAYSFNVKMVGKGKPVILIPGLDCSGDVWDSTAEHLKNNFACYIITLPGFAGQPPIHSVSILKSVATQLANFIKQKHLIKPVIIGHSLGGWLALYLGATYPGLTGDIVSVSSAPFLPALSMGPDITVDSAGKIGMMIKNGMANQTPEQVRQSQKYMLGTMITDSAKIAEVTEMAVKSDQPTQGEVMYELFSNDLRPSMGNIKSRILVLNDWIAYKQYGATHESVYNALKQQYQLAHNVTIKINDDSKHFIMYDDPQWLYKQLDIFLRNSD